MATLRIVLSRPMMTRLRLNTPSVHHRRWYFCSSEMRAIPVPFVVLGALYNTTVA